MLLLFGGLKYSQFLKYKGYLVEVLLLELLYLHLGVTWLVGILFGSDVLIHSFNYNI